MLGVLRFVLGSYGILFGTFAGILWAPWIGAIIAVFLMAVTSVAGTLDTIKQFRRDVLGFHTVRRGKTRGTVFQLKANPKFVEMNNKRRKLLEEEEAPVCPKREDKPGPVCPKREDKKGL